MGNSFLVLVFISYFSFNCCKHFLLLKFLIKGMTTSLTDRLITFFKFFLNFFFFLCLMFFSYNVEKFLGPLIAYYQRPFEQHVQSLMTKLHS